MGLNEGRNGDFETGTPSWASATGVPSPPPGSVAIVGDALPAAAALRAVRGGRSLLHRGHYAHARQLLAAMGRRLAGHRPAWGHVPTPTEAFQHGREEKQIRHDLLSRLVVLLTGPDYRPSLDGAPALGDFGVQVWGPIGAGTLMVPLREWVGAIGAREWYRRGVEVPALGARVRPHYGVFAPVRGEYVGLVADRAERAGMAGRLAFDVGTGTGILAFVLARHGAARVVATDADERAVDCARENARCLGLDRTVEVRKVEPDAPFPPGSADILVCNPPWLPNEAVTPLDRAVYDPGGRFLARFLEGVPGHLRRGGEAWLVLSDLAERLGLRSADHVADIASRVGLAVLGRRTARARHPRTQVRDDPLHSLRSQEVVTLHVLGRPEEHRNRGGCGLPPRPASRVSDMEFDDGPAPRRLCPHR
jgi:methylase of polypeptide subunit release factors